MQGLELPDGLYYVEGEVNLAASNLLATVTIVSGLQLKVNGSVQGAGATVFTPYHDALLFASEYVLSPNSANSDLAEDALKIEGSESFFQGVIVATNGRVELAGERNSFTCPVMGDRVRLNGSKLYISGEDCQTPPKTPTPTDTPVTPTDTPVTPTPTDTPPKDTPTPTPTPTDTPQVTSTPFIPTETPEKCTDRKGCPPPEPKATATPGDPPPTAASCGRRCPGGAGIAPLDASCADGLKAIATVVSRFGSTGPNGSISIVDIGLVVAKYGCAT